ncbi:MAG: aromatic ring-opening dioxygenase LigA [Microterricola sp.]
MSTISSNLDKSLRLAHIASIGAIVLGVVFIVVGIVAWIAVSVTLRAEGITVSEGAPFLEGWEVAGPLTAFSQASIINTHALAMTDGLTYAQLAQDDPMRATVMNASFLRASLFTSVISFGIALFAIGVGIVSILLGWTSKTLLRARGASASAA